MLGKLSTPNTEANKGVEFGADPFFLLEQNKAINETINIGDKKAIKEAIHNAMINESKKRSFIPMLSTSMLPSDIQHLQN